MTEVDFYKELGRRIRLLRKSQKLNQATVAKRVRLTRTSIVNIEKGRQHPTVYGLAQIAAALGVELHKITDPQWILER